MKISVIGDSHSRIFSNTNIFTPFFLGPGSQYNLIQNPGGVEYRVKKILDKIGGNFDYNMLVLGEPSCRYQIINDHYIYQKKYPFFEKVNETHLKNMFETYTNVILNSDKHNLIICAPISVYKQSIYFSKIFSLQMKEFCKEKGILFIDVKKYIIDENNNIEERYLSDPIHASQDILPSIEKCFKDIHLPITLTLQKKESFGMIKSNYKFDKRFGCYVY